MCKNEERRSSIYWSIPDFREYWMIYGGQGFLVVVLCGSKPIPSLAPVSKLDRRHTGRLRKSDNLLMGEGGTTRKLGPVHDLKLSSGTILDCLFWSIYTWIWAFFLFFAVTRRCRLARRQTGWRTTRTPLPTSSLRCSGMHVVFIIIISIIIVEDTWVIIVTLLKALRLSFRKLTWKTRLYKHFLHKIFPKRERQFTALKY